MEFLEKEISGKLMKIFYEVRNKYGKHHREKIYERALAEHFDRDAMSYVLQPHIDCYSLDTGKKLGILIPDILIQDRIILEVKAKPFANEDDVRQAQEYLKTTRYELLYVVNFGEEFFSPRRCIYTNDRKGFLRNIA